MIVTHSNDCTAFQGAIENIKDKHMKYYCICITAAVLLLAACNQQEYYREPFTKDSQAPLPISKVQVTALPGAARITYQVPEDKDLWYVQADYAMRAGKPTQVRSSAYNRSIVVNGFGDTSVHSITLYAVDRSQNKSEPVTVDVKPLRPPVNNAFDSLTMEATFGGAAVKFKNEDTASIAITVLTKDSLNEWTNAGDIFHTSQRAGTFAVRGYDSTEHTFGVYVSDRWGNVSDTLVKQLKPLFEQELDKSRFSAVNLETDYTTPNLNRQVIEHAWDNSLSENDFTTQPGHGLPQWFTFDIGAKARLSRLVVWTRASSRFLYKSGAVKKWEIWGSNAPNPNGAWDDSWQLLLTCEAVKPSGLPAGQNTAEDLAAVKQGWEFTFPLDAPAVRYIRWKTLANWGNVTHITITEISLYGQNE